MKPVNIALIHKGTFGPDGVSRVMECWASMLGEIGHSVTVITKASPKAEPFPRVFGVTSFNYNSAGRGPLVEARVAAAMLFQLHQEYGFDLVISHDSMVSIEVRKMLPQIPLLGTFHSPLVDENRLRNWKYADRFSRRLKYPATWAVVWLKDLLALRAVNHVHTLSKYTWKRLCARYPSQCEKVPWSKIPGSFDQRRFVSSMEREAVRAQLGIAPEEKLLLTVRRLVSRNGVDRVIRCAATLKGLVKNVRYIIGGTGPLQESLSRQIREAGVSNVVHLTGYIGEKELPLYYQSADLFLLPTRDLECFGLPIIEAMACGCPSLVLPEGGPAEVCAKHPEWIARENTDEAFIELVRRHLLGPTPKADGISEEAVHCYSNQAIRPLVTNLIESLSKNG